MAQGRWYPNGLLNFYNALTSPARPRLSWLTAGGNTIYVAIVGTTGYNPLGSNYVTDAVLSDITTADSPTPEAVLSSGYFRKPVSTIDPTIVTDTTPAGHHLELGASADVVYTVMTGGSFTGYWAAFYRDANSPSGEYLPNGANNTLDNQSPVIGFMPVVDVDGNHTWTGPNTLVLPITLGVFSIITDPP